MTLSGPEIIAEVRARCRITEDGCWRWLLALSIDGRPVMSLKAVTGRNTRYAHRVAWLASGLALAKSHVLVSVCGHNDCCNPEHRRAMTRRGWEHTPERHARRSRGARHSAVVTAARRKGKNLRFSMEVARRLRARYEQLGTLTAVAREFGLRVSDVHRIVRGQYWRERGPFDV